MAASRFFQSNKFEIINNDYCINDYIKDNSFENNHFLFFCTSLGILVLAAILLLCINNYINNKFILRK